MESARAALVIAAHEFVDPKFQRLRSPAKDADALACVLADAAIGGFEVQTVVNQPSSVVAQELERFFSGRKPDDLLLLYFSCHGVKDPAGRLYFVTTNTTFDLLRSTGVSASFVGEQMEYSRSKRIVVLLDCCYSGAFLKGFRARGDDSVAVDELEGRGRAVITASRATEYAFEADDLASDNAQPSMFTGAIVEGLSTGAADANGDGLVTVDELYDYVYDAVRGRVAGQTPGRWIDVEGDLVVARNPSPPVRAAVLPPELRRAVESDVALQRLGAVSELAQWYRDDDPARQLAAGQALDQLVRDYDERVKAAATAALAGAVTRAAAALAAAPIPMTAPAAPGPGPTPAAAPGSDEAVAGDRSGRGLGLLAGVGGLAVLLAPYFDYIRADGYATNLRGVPLFSLGTLMIFLLAGLAAYCLLRSARGKATSLAVLAALVPVMAGQALVNGGELVYATGKGALGPGPGWFLIQGGLALLAVAGIAATVRLRRYASVASSRLADLRNAGAVGTVAAALVAGAAASFGWARMTGNTGAGWFGVVPAAQTLVVRLLGLSALAPLAWRWAHARHAKRPEIFWGTLLLSGVAVALFLSDQIRLGYKPLYSIAFTAFALGAAVVPLLATLVVPARLGAVALAAWVVGAAAWLPSAIANDLDGGLLAVALVGAALLAAVLAKPALPRRAVTGHSEPAD